PASTGGRGAGTGTTPARAGSTSLHSSEPDSDGDHPRACGEHGQRLGFSLARRGPPPRVRGAQSPRGPAPRPRGTTPARAGSTLPDLHVYPPVTRKSANFTGPDNTRITEAGLVNTNPSMPGTCPTEQAPAEHRKPNTNPQYKSAPDPGSPPWRGTSTGPGPGSISSHPLT